MRPPCSRAIAVADRQTESRPDALRLGGEERVEDLGPDLGAIPGPESATSSRTSSSLATVRTTIVRAVSTETSACSALMSRLRSICCSSEGSAQKLWLRG